MNDHGVTRVTRLIFRKDRRDWPVVVWWLVLVVVVDTLLGVGSPLALGPRLHRFTHAGSFEAALEAFKKVSALLHFSFFFTATSYMYPESVTIYNNLVVLKWRDSLECSTACFTKKEKKHQNGERRIPRGKNGKLQK